MIEPNGDQLGVLGWRRQDDHLVPILAADVWKSQLLDITIRLEEGSITAYDPDGNPFKTPVDIRNLLDQSQKTILDQAAELATSQQTISDQAAELATSQQTISDQAAELDALKAELERLKGK